MPEEFELIEDRLISGKGVLRIPQEPEWRWFRIVVSVIRLPKINFLNFKWQKIRSEYAKVQVMRSASVLCEYVINYESNTFDIPAKEPGAFYAPAIACIAQSLDESLSEIKIALGITTLRLKRRCCV
jgi:hypothetical protein